MGGQAARWWTLIGQVDGNGTEDRSALYVTTCSEADMP